MSNLECAVVEFEESEISHDKKTRKARPFVVPRGQMKPMNQGCGSLAEIMEFLLERGSMPA
jgi:hypothetical protein